MPTVAGACPVHETSRADDRPYGAVARLLSAWNPNHAHFSPRAASRPNHHSRPRERSKVLQRVFQRHSDVRRASESTVSGPETSASRPPRGHRNVTPFRMGNSHREYSQYPMGVLGAPRTCHGSDHVTASLKLRHRPTRWGHKARNDDSARSQLRPGTAHVR